MITTRKISSHVQRALPPALGATFTHTALVRRTHPPCTANSLSVKLSSLVPNPINIKQVLCGCCYICFPPSPHSTFLYLLISFFSFRQDGLWSQNVGSSSILRQITVFSLTPPCVSAIKSRSKDTFPKHHKFKRIPGETLPYISPSIHCLKG